MVAFPFKTLFSFAPTLSLVSQAAAISISKIGDFDTRDGLKVVQLDFAVHRNSANSAGGTVPTKRDSPVSVVLLNEKSFYLTDIYLGSNKQHVQVDIDTGSSDLWVVTSDVQCTGKSDCKSYGVFDPLASTTFKKTDQNFGISYVDHTGSTGYYGLDDFSFSTGGSGAVKGLQFGVVDQTSTNIGIFGIGFSSLEADAQKNNIQYDNLPVLMAKQGVISKEAYSLFLNDVGEQGTILFGGIDQAKYSGKLVLLPLAGDPSRLSVILNNVSAGGQSYSVDKAVTLDSGSTYSYLPEASLSLLGDSIGGSKNYDSLVGTYYTLPCNTRGSLSFNFDGVSIEVPFSDLLTNLGDGGGNCLFDILTQSDEYILLGDNFLRHAYSFYDLSDGSISLAQAKYTSDSAIVSA